MPEHKTLLPVRGEVVEIIRGNVSMNFGSEFRKELLMQNDLQQHFSLNNVQDKTEVKTREGASEFTYCLDEGLVEFGTAVNDNDFGRAILFLETLGDVPAAKAMWHNLANVALKQQIILVKYRKCMFNIDVE